MNSVNWKKLQAVRRSAALANVFILLLVSGTANMARSQAPSAAAPQTSTAPAGDMTGLPSTEDNSATGQTRNGSNDNNNTRNQDSSRNGDERNPGERPTLAPPLPRSQFQNLVQTTTGTDLPIFGASLFTEVPSTFAPVTDVPVGAGYILGPGDQINLQLSGQINQQLRVVVDRNGAISLPGLGAVQVAGLPYSELTNFLNARLGRIYRNFTLNTNLASLRTIQVFVFGQARRPGAYSISSLSTLTNAIFASGGALPQGSLRDIQVKRGGLTIDHFDLYDLLLRGDKTHDIPLATGDVIFIPFVGPQVAIAGSVDTPAIYELKGNTTINEALAMAGGETAVAAAGLVRLQRVYEHRERSIIDVPEQSRLESLRNGDILTVGAVTDRFHDSVTLRGNVANPGRYVWHAGMHIMDLIPNRESLITRNYWRQREQLGQSTIDYLPDQTTPATQTAPVTPAQPGSLQVHGNEADTRSQNTAQTGAATASAGGNSVGTALTANNSPFTARNDVVLSAPDIDWSYAVIERLGSDNLTTSLIPFNLGKIVLDRDPAQNYELLPGDVVSIFSKSDIRVPSTQQTRFVRLEGEFVSAGVYSVSPGETLRSLLRRAGGFTPDAYLYGSEFTRESTQRVEQQRLNEYADELDSEISSVSAANKARAVSASDQTAAAASQEDASSAVARLRNLRPIGRIVLDLNPNSSGIDAVPDIALEDGDRFVVPHVPANVTVEGQVYNANAFVFIRHKRVVDYLRQAGGPDRDADKRRLFLLRADGSVVSRQYSDVLHSPIFPGDTIVVPPILDKRALTQRIVDIASIAGNLGIAIAAIAIAAHQ